LASRSLALAALALAAAEARAETPALLGRTRVTVAVVQVQGAVRRPEQDAAVVLRATGADGAVLGEWLGTTGPDGSVTLDGVSVLAGTRVTATVGGAGIPYESEPATLEPDVPAGLVVETWPRGGDPSGLRVARLETELYLWEKQVGVEQTWHLVNLGEAAFDPAAAPPGPGADGVELAVPHGARGLRCVNLPRELLEVAGHRARYKGVLRPGRQRAVEVRLAWYLPYEGDRLLLSQTSAWPIDEAVTVVPEVPVVRNRRLEDVRLTVARHDQREVEHRVLAGGHTFSVLRGPDPAGGRTLELELAGLPRRSHASGWAAVALALLAMVWVVGHGLLGRRRGRS